MGASRKKGV
jgi:hypothetical protein